MSAVENAFAYKNIRLYSWFTIFYNARAYYPILAILFVDLGLKIEDYNRLNALWAGAILLLEIPSGALADTIGRKKLVVFSAILMGIEMAMLLFAPINGGALLLTMCILNRLLSGVSEAAASGADQSLAYDTLEKDGKANLWEDQVLPIVMRWRSVGFVISMAIGGLLYDAELLNKCLGFIGIEALLTSEQSMRFPIALVFLQSIACFIMAIQMRDPETDLDVDEVKKVKSAFSLTWKTTVWALKSPKILKVILGVMLVDAFVRNYATITAAYYREIQLPEWSFGLMGATSGLLGIFTPELAKWLNKRYSAPMALSWTALIAGVGLIGVGFCVPYWGALPSILCMSTFGLFNYIGDNNLHKLTDSSKRATLLSIKGLCLNLGYGTCSLLFAQAVAFAKRPELAAEQGEKAFSQVLSFQPYVYFILFAAYFIWIYKTPKTNAG